MNKLSKKQKNIIIDYIKDGYFNCISSENDIFKIELLIEKFNNESILIKQLEKANDYENLLNDYKRMKNDLLFKDTINDKINYVINFI